MSDYQNNDSANLTTNLVIPNVQELIEEQNSNKPTATQTAAPKAAASVTLEQPQSLTIKQNTPARTITTVQEEAEKLLAQTAAENKEQEAYEKEQLEQLIIKEEAADTIEFNFDNASLGQLLNYISEIFNYTFLAPDIFNPLPQNEKAVNGNLITFKTNRPLSKQEAWDLFITFVDMAGFAVVPQGQPHIFKIMSLDPAKRAPLPTFIGVSPQSIPSAIANSDQLIRYIYFVENTTVESLVGGPGKPQLLDQLKSPESIVLALKEHNAILMVDKAYNIVNLMQIVKELDKVTMPQAMSVLKLRRADATEVKALYDTLIKNDDKTALGPNRLLQRKQPTSLYFPENTKIIAEPRTNSLILLGPLDAIQKIENFIIEYVDVEMDKPFSPLFVYPVRYADAENIADIMNKVTRLGKDKPVGQSGGIRGVDKFFKLIEFFPEKTTNRLIIKGDYEDYLKAVEIIKQLDEPQPQVAIEILLMTLNVTDLRILGTQLRNRVPCGINGVLGGDIAFQTSGSFTNAGNLAQGIITQPLPPTTTPPTTTTIPGISRLLGDLINLVTLTGAGNTIVTLGDSLGVWALLQALQTLNSTQVLANPFILATNKTKAQVAVGITQRVVASQVIQAGSDIANTFKDETANLTVNVVPLINSDGMITLDLNVSLENFIGQFDPNFVQKNSRTVSTKTVVADKEVIAIGGLIQASTTDQESKFPILGDIPLIGWLFKNKNKNQTKDDLLILVSTQIIKPEPDNQMNDFTRRHVSSYEGALAGLYSPAEQRDPIRRFFFDNKQEDADGLFNDFIFQRHKQERITAAQARNKRRRGLGKNKPNGPEYAEAPTATTGATL